ncbi:MAG: hypothetical protein J6A75_10260 [Lachnospiraceae bacterium]|nr:hypothetical protein [Lachnospiraceae bacterium]
MTSGYDEETGKYIIGVCVDKDYIVDYANEQMDLEENLKEAFIQLTLRENDTDEEEIGVLMEILKLSALLGLEEFDIEIVAAYVNLDGETTYY